MRSRKPDAAQMTLELNPDDEFERIIDARVAERAEAQAFHWRVRLIVIESVMLATLVVAAGIALDLSAMKILTAAAIAGGGCFLTGFALIGLTGAASRLLARFRRKA